MYFHVPSEVSKDEEFSKTIDVLVFVSLLKPAAGVEAAITLGGITNGFVVEFLIFFSVSSAHMIAKAI